MDALLRVLSDTEKASAVEVPKFMGAEYKACLSVVRLALRKSTNDCLSRVDTKDLESFVAKHSNLGSLVAQCDWTKLQENYSVGTCVTNEEARDIQARVLNLEMTERVAENVAANLGPMLGECEADLRAGVENMPKYRELLRESALILAQFMIADITLEKSSGAASAAESKATKLQSCLNFCRCKLKVTREMFSPKLRQHTDALQGSKNEAQEAAGSEQPRAADSTAPQDVAAVSPTQRAGLRRISRAKP